MQNTSSVIDLLRSWVLCFYILIYVYSNIISQYYGVSPTVQKILVITVFAIFTCILKVKRSNLKDINIFSVLFVVLLVLHFFLCPPYNFSVSHLLNILVLFLFAIKRFQYESLKYISYAIKIAALVISISAYILYMKYGFYVRNEIIVDKQLTSCIYSLCYVFCWIDIIFSSFNYAAKHNRKRLIELMSNIICLLFILYSNFVIIGSKTSVFALPFVIFALYINCKDDMKRHYKKILYITMIMSLLFLIFYSRTIFNDDIKEGINHLFNAQIYELNRGNNREITTFSVRSIIIEYCMNLFSQYPVLGIGLGNFDYYNRSMFSTLKETESSVLSVITEGGIYYTLLLLWFYFILIRKAICSLKKHFAYEYCIALAIPVMFFVICIGNDFMDNMYWLMMGISYSILYTKKVYK